MAAAGAEGAVCQLPPYLRAMFVRLVCLGRRVCLRHCAEHASRAVVALTNGLAETAPSEGPETVRRIRPPATGDKYQTDVRVPMHERAQSMWELAETLVNY